MKKVSIQKQLFAFAAFVAVAAVFILGMEPVQAGAGVSLGFALTTGFTKICGPRSGGVTYLWLANVADIASFTLNSGTGEYSAVTMVSGKVFYKFEFDQDTAHFSITAALQNKSLMITKALMFYLGKLTQAHRNRLQDICDASNCGMIAIVQDSTGLKWVLGYTENFLLERPLFLKGITSTTGKMFTDANGSEITLDSIDNEEPRTYTGVVPVV